MITNILSAVLSVLNRGSMLHNSGFVVIVHRKGSEEMQRMIAAFASSDVMQELHVERSGGDTTIQDIQSLLSLLASDTTHYYFHCSVTLDAGGSQQSGIALI